MTATGLAVADHGYLSTACAHGLHEECGAGMRARGEIGPPHCKFCPAVCLCPECQHGVIPLPVRARAFYRNYHYPEPSDGRSARVTRLHIIREDGRRPGQEGWCATSATRHRASQPVILDPMPAVPPAGLKWCPMCIGKLVERAGLLDGVAALLASAALRG